MVLTNGGTRPFYVGPRRGTDAKAITTARDDVLAMRSVRKYPGARTVLRYLTEPERRALVG